MAKIKVKACLCSARIQIGQPGQEWFARAHHNTAWAEILLETPVLTSKAAAINAAEKAAKLLGWELEWEKRDGEET